MLRSTTRSMASITAPPISAWPVTGIRFFFILRAPCPADGGRAVPGLRPRQPGTGPRRPGSAGEAAGPGFAVDLPVLRPGRDHLPGAAAPESHREADYPGTPGGHR